MRYIKTNAAVAADIDRPTWIGRPGSREGDVRDWSNMLRAGGEKVALLITSRPYLDITDYHEDQWLRLSSPAG